MRDYGAAAERTAVGAAVAALSAVAIVLVAILGFAVLSPQSVMHVTTSTTTVTQTTTVTTTTYSTPSLAYLSSAGGCEANGKPVPCWGSPPYLFNCLSEAETPQGCTRLVVTTTPGWNFSVNVRYPFVNQTQPSWTNCVWSLPGMAGQQGYGYCSLVNSTSFTVGEPASPRQ